MLAYLSSILLVIAINLALSSPLHTLAFSMAVALSFFSLIVFLEYLALRADPLLTLKRLFFLSFLSNLVMLFILVTGFLLLSLRGIELGSLPPLLLLGAMTASSFRLIVYRALFLKNLYQALVVALVQPLVVVLCATYPLLTPQLFRWQPAYLAGLTTLVASVAFSVILDKKGKEYFGVRPFDVIRAFLLAWLGHRAEELEKIIEKSSIMEVVKTKVLSFESDSMKAGVVVSDAHPGPFRPVGSSDLPFLLHSWFNDHGYSTIVLHGISGHEMNIASKSEVLRYLSFLESLKTADMAKGCTKPLVKKLGNAQVLGIAFGDTALLTLTLSPFETEDLPSYVKDRIEELGRKVDFKEVVVVDSHNSVGEKPDPKVYEEACEAAHQVLKELRKSPQHTFRVGYSHSSEFGFSFDGDVGLAGIGMLVIDVEGMRLFLMGADANNARLGLREALIEAVAGPSHSIFELCTSDTHTTISEGGKDHKGYFALGDLTEKNVLLDAARKLKAKALSRLEEASFTLKLSEARVKVMGSRALDDFSVGLDRCSRLAKIGALTIGALLLALLVSLSLL